MLTVNIGGTGYVLSSQVEIDLNDVGSWDNVVTTNWSDASERDGKDFYIYACQPAGGYAPDFVLSNHSTVPDGYTANNSRKIGGFHCLCADAGTDVYAYDNSRDDLSLLDQFMDDHDITNASSDYHWLKGFVQGDVIPFSIWDLNHRPESQPEGMTYDIGCRVWIGIYLPSWTGVKVESAFGATIASGNESGSVGDETYFFPYRWQQQLGRIGQMPISEVEFQSSSLGSPQGVNIAGSADPGTTGGHSATNGLRIISLVGCEDMCGVYWQWGRDRGHIETASAWSNSYLSSDINVGGQHRYVPSVALFGGNWASGSKCGSRGSAWNASPLYLHGSNSSRAVSVSRSRGV